MIDITLPITEEMLTWPGGPGVELVPLKRLSEGHDADVSELRLGTHTGTHLDPPSHALLGGASSESIDLDILSGPAWVGDFTHVESEISAGELSSRMPSDTFRVLLKTRNSSLWDRPGVPFPASFIALSVEAAEWLAASQVRLVGIDFLSIEARGDATRPVHVALLSAGVLILEGLDLRLVSPGPYHLTCLPLKLIGSDGVPARAVLLPIASG